MAWEVIDRITHKGENLKVWASQDAEGEKIYAVTQEDDLYQPTGGVYSTEQALDNYDLSKEM